MGLVIVRRKVFRGGGLFEFFMKDYEQGVRNVTRAVVVILIAATLLFGFMGKPNYLEWVMEFGISIIIGAWASAVSTKFVQKITKGILDTFLFSLEIKGVKVSVTLTMVFGFIVKIWLFGSI
jgi:hypothetical protein